MGPLTDGMARLCGEIVGLRLLRRAFVQDLERNVAQLRASFRQAHDERSGTSRAERAQAIYDLKVSVAGLRQENLLDLQGARRAWSGLAPGQSRPPKHAKPPPKAPSRPGAGRGPAGEPVRQTSPATGETSKRPPAQGGARRRSPAKGKKPGNRPQPKKKGGAGT